MLARTHSMSGQKRGRQSGDEEQGETNQTQSPLARTYREIANFAQHIAGGDIKQAQAFLSRGGEWLNRRLHNEFGDTPLTLAVRRGNQEMVKMMLNHRCNPNGLNGEDDIPLVLAVEFKQLQVVKYLLECEFGCDPDRNDSRALFECIQSKQFEVFELLLKAKVDINVRDNCDRTPLMHAAGLCKSSEISSRFVSTLLAWGAKVNSLDEDCSTPLCYAYVAKNWDSAKVLLNRKARISMRYGGEGLLVLRERMLVNSFFKAIVEHCVDEVQSGHVLGAIESLGLDGSLPRGVALVVLEYLKYLW